MCLKTFVSFPYIHNLEYQSCSDSATPFSLYKNSEVGKI